MRHVTKFIKSTFSFLIFTSLSCFALASAVPSKECMAIVEALDKKSDEKVEAPLFKIGPQKNLLGLTEHGFKKVLDARQSLISADHLMNYNFFEVESDVEALRIAQVGQYNIQATGGPGGAKTDFFRKGIPGLWVKQVHEMMNEVPLIGGQTHKGAQEGREDINSSGTMLDARYAMIDEGQNMNPAVALAMLSLINEKAIFSNGIERKAKQLRTVVFTGNANQYELRETFRESGRGPSGVALFNRLHIKIDFQNWLSDESQAKLDKLERKRKHLLAISQSDKSILEDLIFQKPEAIDDDTIERFAFAFFETNDEFEVVLRTFVQKLKEATAAAVQDSARDAKDDKDKTPYVLVPSVKFTTRLRKEVANFAIVSAALDYLRSPLATPENLAKLGEKKIKLGPLSLWRTWPLLTVVGGNQVVFDPFKQTIHFEAKVIGKNEIQPQDHEKLIREAEDKRDEVGITHRKEGQGRFFAALSNQWTHLKSVSEEVARITDVDLDEIDLDKTDFELTLAKHGSPNVMKLK